MKSILISGVSGGMGLATLKKYSESGYFVYGLDIKKPNGQYNNFKFIKCDLTNSHDIEDAFDVIKKETNHIDIIVCLAGIYLLDSLVEISEEEYLRIFNINVFSVYRINKTFIPLLDNSSRIIIITSELAPLDPLPYTGLYAITKSTLDKYAYSLRMELQLLGIKVIVIRSGAVDTPLIGDSIDSLNRFVNKTELYKENSLKFRNIVNKVESRKIKPERIAQLIYKISNKKRPKYVYNINRNLGLRLLSILPKRLQNYIIYKIIK